MSVVLFLSWLLLFGCEFRTSDFKTINDVIIRVIVKSGFQDLFV